MRLGLSMKRTASADEGFVSVDATVALTILATILVLALGAARTAIRLMAAAADARQAEGELRYLIDIAPRTHGVTSGRGAGFDWRVVNQPSGGTRTIQICTRTATVLSSSSGRRYSLATAETCPP